MLKLRVGAMNLRYLALSSCVAVLCLALEASMNGQSQLPSEGLTFEVLSTQSTITGSSKAEVLLHLRNMTAEPIKEVTIKLFIPDFVTAEWLDLPEGAPARYAMAYRIREMAPTSDVTVRVRLGVKERARFERPNAIFETRYTWFPEPGRGQIVTVYRTINLETGPVQDIGVSGITLAFAIWIIPGLAVLISFGAFVDLPEALDDAKYVAGFMLSVVALQVTEYLKVTQVRVGVSINDLLWLAVGGAVAGSILGWSARFSIDRYKRRYLPLHERYPPPDTDDLGELLATYVLQTGSVESAPLRVTLKTGDVFSGLSLTAKNGQDIFLLPLQYQVAGDHRVVGELKAAYERKDVSAVARELKKLGHQLQVTDGSKKITNQLEEGFDGCLRRVAFRGSEIDRRSWDQAKIKKFLTFDDGGN